MVNTHMLKSITNLFSYISIKISKTTSDKIKSLQIWNNKKGMIGKGVYSENNIYFEQTMLLLNAPEELISMQFIIYEVEVYKFYQSLNIRKFNI